jgi:hypothetical protein
MAGMVLTKEEALAGLRTTHAEFVGRLADFTPDRWVAPLRTGTWRVRDVAAHVAAWDRLLVETLRALPNDQLPDWLSWGDDARTDELNEQHVRNAASLTLDQLRAEVLEARVALLDVVATLDATQFTQTHRAGTVETSADRLCAWWLRHDREHLAELPAERKGNSAD